MGDARAREHDGCPYMATVWLGEHSREWWFCNKCGWSAPFGPTDRAVDASGHPVWFNGVAWFHENPADDDTGCVGATPAGARPLLSNNTAEWLGDAPAGARPDALS